MKKYLRQLTKIETGNDYLDESIYDYLIYGLPPGSFTKAVLENNLLGAVNSADHFNAENLVHIVRQISYSMPLVAWGSPEKVKAWLSDEDGRRTQYSDDILERATMLKLEDV